MTRPFSIYLATNQKTGKWYVGKTGNTVRDRWTDHKSNARCGASGYLYRSMRRHGEDAFVVDTVTEVPTEAEANNLERLWIILLKSHTPEFGYNLTLGGDGVRHNEETKQKLRTARIGFRHSDETKALISRLTTGRTHTLESRLKMSIAQTGRVASVETRAKQSAARIGRFGGEKHPMWGRKQTPESIEQAAAKKRGRPSWNKGLAFSEESRRKMSAAQSAKYDSPAGLEVKAVLSAASKSLWENPEYRAKMKISQDARYARERAEREARIANNS